MSRIVIHIGTHKTATTHVQDTFHKNRALLKQHGVIVPYIGRARGQHGLASAWIRLPLHYKLRNPIRAWEKLARTYAGRPYTVFVSSEELSRQHPNRVDMQQLRELVSGFDEVQILCTLRNQASFLQSVYQEISKGRNPAAVGPFLQRALQTHMVDGLALDYGALYSHILTGFAPENIHFLSYEAAVAGEGGIIGAFLRILAVPLAADQLRRFSDRNSNVSDDPLATFAANMTAAPRVAPRDLVNVVRRTLEQTLDQGTDAKRPPSTLYGRAELKQIADCFAPLNAAFCERLAPCQPGFRIAPMLNGRTELTYRGALSEDFWVNLCRNLRSR